MQFLYSFFNSTSVSSRCTRCADMPVSSLGGPAGAVAAAAGACSSALQGQHQQQYTQVNVEQAHLWTQRLGETRKGYT